ncbi:hypothetical protein Q2347_26340, partial [Escherichia coli]|nr:hypothetical protein [Escherichia coli]
HKLLNPLQGAGDQFHNRGIEQFMAIAPLPVAEQSEMPERYDIRFDNVSYRYEEGDGHALNHVSLTFPAASMSALVGASGAGKTT